MLESNLIIRTKISVTLYLVEYFRNHLFHTLSVELEHATRPFCWETNYNTQQFLIVGLAIFKIPDSIKFLKVQKFKAIVCKIVL